MAHQNRYEALQIEAVSSGRKNAAVEMKWADLLYIDIPQELYDQLLLQKEACQNILEGKDRRIREFLTELRNKDEEYCPFSVVAFSTLVLTSFKPGR